jgi:Uroporphyrinogen decarboxylase (URO-D)
VIGLDWRVDLDAAWARLGNDVAVQANLDPTALLAPIPEIRRRAAALYDLDVEARATAAKHGLAFARASTANDHPLFVRMLTPPGTRPPHHTLRRSGRAAGW